MSSLPTGAAWRPYLRVLADTALDAATAGGWIAAGGLPPGRRRLARAGVMAVAAATAVPGLTAAKSAADSAAKAAPAAPGAAEPAAPAASEPSVEPGDGPAGGDRPPLVVLRDTPVAVPVGRRATAAQVAAAVAVLGVITAASAGVAVAGRRLERRWLARLIRQGHPHPHRALGLRMAAVWAAASLPARLYTARNQAGRAR
jgi:hypothetical protein